jgi:hypothetical protein
MGHPVEGVTRTVYVAPSLVVRSGWPPRSPDKFPQAHESTFCQAPACPLTCRNVALTGLEPC